MPVIVDSDKNTQNIRFNIDAVFIPTFAQLEDFMSADAPIVNFRLEGSPAFHQLSGGKEDITSPEFLLGIALRTVFISEAVGDRISLE